MIHAYAFIWRCLTHDIIIEIEKKHLCMFITSKSAHKVGNGINCQPVYKEYMKGEEGVWGRQPPRSQQNVKEVK